MYTWKKKAKAAEQQKQKEKKKQPASQEIYPNAERKRRVEGA